MAYNPTNNPYVPGDPYSYDLKWIILQLKQCLANIQTALSDASAATDSASQALNTANDAAYSASEALNVAEAALEAAEQAAGIEVIDVYGSDSTKQIEDVLTDYTWDELCEKVATGKVFFRIFESGDSALYIPPAFPARIMKTYNDTWVNANIQIDSFTSNFGGTADPMGIYIRKAYISQNFSGTYGQVYYAFPS